MGYLILRLQSEYRTFTFQCRGNLVLSILILLHNFFSSQGVSSIPSLATGLQTRCIKRKMKSPSLQYTMITMRLATCRNAKY